MALVAEADGNRTRLTEILGHTGFEDQHLVLVGVHEYAFPQVSSVRLSAGVHVDAYGCDCLWHANGTAIIVPALAARLQ
jgi:hypothetical protein